MTPQKLALNIALGGVISISPLWGTTTVICAIIAIVFKLNLIAIQVANYAFYPLQLILIVPYFRLGSYFFIDKNELIMPIEELIVHIQHSSTQSLSELSGWILSATLVWLITAVPIFFVIFIPTKFILSKWNSRK